MVDTGSVVSLITKRIAQEIESHDSSAWWGRHPISMKLKSFNISAIKNLGTLYSGVQKSGWNSGRVDLIVVQIHIGQSLEETYSKIWDYGCINNLPIQRIVMLLLNVSTSKISMYWIILKVLSKEVFRS